MKTYSYSLFFSFLFLFLSHFNYDFIIMMKFDKFRLPKIDIA